MSARAQPRPGTAAGARPPRWERRPDERPHELLDAALAVFAERGYRNARLEEVAEVAGVTKGTIYHYFATKEELLVRALEHNHERVFGRFEELLRGQPGPASARIRLLLRKGLGNAGSGHVLRLLLQSVAHEVPDVFRRWLATGPLRLWRLVAALIEEGKASGEFRSDVDGDVVARVFVSGLMLQAVWRPACTQVPELSIDEDRLLDSSVEFFLHGLRPLFAAPDPAPRT